MPDSFAFMGLHCMCASAVKLYKAILKLYFICICAYINFIYYYYFINDTIMHAICRGAWQIYIYIIYETCQTEQVWDNSANIHGTSDTLVLECVYSYHLNTQINGRISIWALHNRSPVMAKALTPFTFVRLFPALEEITMYLAISILHWNDSYPAIYMRNFQHLQMYTKVSKIMKVKRMLAIVISQ